MWKNNNERLSPPTIINKHPLDLINERLENEYYAKMPPYSYSRDATAACYLLGYCSKVEYQIVESKYDMFNRKLTSKKIVI